MTRTPEQAPTHDLTLDGREAAGKGALFGWVLYDCAIMPYFLLVNIFVFAPYFTQTVVGDPVRGQATWGYLQAAAGICIALLSPFFGSLADAAGPRKPGIAIFSMLASIGMCGLWYAVPGDPAVIWLVGACVVIAATNLEFGVVYHSAMLPAIVPWRRIGLLFGLATAFGFLASILAFLLWLTQFGLPEMPALGLDRLANEHNRIVGPLSALWLWVFALPLLLLTPDQARTGRSRIEAARHGLKMIIDTVRQLPRYKNIAIYLLARMIYYDGQSAVFIFTGVYAASVFDWQTSQIGIYGLMIIIAQVPASLIGGWVDDRIGSKPTIVFSLVGFSIGLITLLGTTPTTALFLPIDSSVIESTGLVGTALNSAGFDSWPQRIFLCIGVITGLFSGPSMSSSRTLLARIAPSSMTGEFFGLYAVCGKATSFLAPLTIAVITSVTHDQRWGLASALVFIVLGLALLGLVREERADAHAR